MDGFLPPVDNQSWIQYQRQRAERFARQRIAAAGATAGDWIGRATQTVDTLVPDWPTPAPAPPPEPAPSPLSGAQDWAQGALERIGQVGSDVGAGIGDTIDRAQGLLPAAQAAVQGPLERIGGLISQPDAPDPLGPGAPGVQGVQDVLGAARDTVSAVADPGTWMRAGLGASPLGESVEQAFAQTPYQFQQAVTDRLGPVEAQDVGETRDAVGRRLGEAPLGQWLDERQADLRADLRWQDEQAARLALGLRPLLRETWEAHGQTAVPGTLPGDRPVEDAEWQQQVRQSAVIRETAENIVGGVTPRTALRTAPRTVARGLVARDIPELMSALPLAAPTSLATNFTGGMARSLERVLGKVGEGRPAEAVVDLVAMLRAMPGAARNLRRSYSGGPTAENPGMTGEAIKEGLGQRAGAARHLTAGTAANAATDAFWRQVNETGAGAAARRRGLGAVETARLRQSAGDFATFSGPNSRVAQELTKLKRTIHDPNAPFVDKAAAWGVTSMAPYVMMPERLLRATVGALVPVESAVGVVRAFQRGDKAAARELAGRAAAGMATTALLTKMYLDGAITGDAPEDANERRRREAQGAQWNTIALPGGGRISTRPLGSVGMQANAVATTLDNARRVQDKGGDPGAVLEAGVNGAAKWFLDASYLSDLQEFTEQWGKGNLTGGVRSIAAGLPSRLTSPVTGAINAADPYEREADEFPEMVASRTGLRAAVPTRIDPTTGEDQRRRGTGLSRYWGERGSETSAEATELARLELQPRVLGRTEDFEGGKQTPAQRRAAQRALGSETGKAVREAMAKPSYAGLDDAGKKSALQAALRTAGERADVVLGEGVTRGPKQQAQREWDAVPKYVGVQGTPDEVRTQNAAITRAQSLESAYKKQYGDGGWRSKLREDEPEAFALINKMRRDAGVLVRQREAIEKKYGVTLS